MIHLLDISPSELKNFIADLGEKPFRAKQLLEWIWQKKVYDFNQMTNLSKAFREKLINNAQILTSQVIDKSIAPDGTTKVLLKLADGQLIESVCIVAPKRKTACISTQVGCAMGCKFCASGLNGVARNLTAGEIVEQVIQLELATGHKISNVVFMGLGEPLANYDATVDAVRCLIDPARLGLSARKITVSTVGLPEQIKKLAREQLSITLAISLHAPTDELRQKIMPISSKYSIKEVLKAAAEFFYSKKREVTLEYLLIKDVNDSEQCAHDLAKQAALLRCNVNLIRYNPVSGLAYQRPEDETVARFAEILELHGLNVNVRKSKGLESDAACGQLRKRKSES